jgi:uncharacterized protein YdcH (DUF465 family)
MKYIQSFYQYPVTFSSIQKTIPARGAQGDLKNIAEIKEAELEILETREPFFRELVNNKKIRVLNHLPESYKSSAIRINEANDEIARLKEENEKLKKLTEKTESVEETETVKNAETEKTESSVKTETAQKKTKKKK